MSLSYPATLFLWNTTCSKVNVLCSYFVSVGRDTVTPLTLTVGRHHV